MKQAAPIKRSSALIGFSRDHHFGLLMIWRIKQDLKSGKNHSEIASYLNDFCQNDLTLHFRDEETYLFSLLPAKDALRMRAEQEHEALYSMMKAVERGEADHELLHGFSQLLEKHIRFEERELFGHLEQSVDGVYLAEICGRIHSHHPEKKTE
jgi:hemerythrin-like domain-containing protein